MPVTKPATTRPCAAMIVIGDEILSGRTREGNAHHLAGVLTQMGIRLVEVRVVADDLMAIADAVNELRARVDYLFTSGGIGPTHDDITAESVAAAFGVSIGVRDDARAILERYYGGSGINEARLRMARIPDGATLIDNPLSQAPGFQLDNVMVMAGVPAIFQVMLASVRPALKGGPPVRSWAFRVPVPEGDVAGPLGAIAAAHPEVSLGSYPFYRGGLGTTLIARSDDPEKLAAAATALREMLVNMDATNVEETPPD